ncbi:hypothetical protein SASPL_126896 [Salvia splendens]|uniref:Uncharacterized protein n=1 Tax=Salvia splendens TaxID=180675 RepID=A0A8X8ZRF0_SALSN|nr:hypothetical protein SASPL_126896 [Salvia splendens]
MSAGAAGEGFQRGFCISGRDMSIERRPYHKNCKCALHKDNKVRERHRCTHASPTNSVSFPIRRTWSESCLNASSLTTFASAVQGNFTRTRTHLDLVLYKDVDDDHEVD